MDIETYGAIVRDTVDALPEQLREQQGRCYRHRKSAPAGEGDFAWRAVRRRTAHGVGERA